MRELQFRSFISLYQRDPPPIIFTSPSLNLKAFLLATFVKVSYVRAMFTQDIDCYIYTMFLLADKYFHRYRSTVREVEERSTD